MPVRPDRNDFASLAKYVKYINTTFEPRKNIFVGSFYSFVYDVNGRELTVPYKKLKFYDLMPLVFLFDKHPKHDHLVRGINFHHMPINIRFLYVQKMKKLATNNFNKDTRILLLNEYDKLVNMYRKATRASIRNYDVSRIKHLRKIPNSEIDKVINYYADTYYGINIGMVEARYLSFI